MQYKEDRQNRPVDDRIPQYWRDGFKSFAGYEPTYEEYMHNPLLWSDKIPTMRELIKSFLIIGLAIGLAVAYLYLQTKPH